MRSSSSADLSDLAALARVEGAELRGAVIRAQAELFAAASALDGAAIRAFESIMTGLVGRADPAEIESAAALLAPLPQTPPRVLEALIAASPAAARIVLAKAPRLPPGAAGAAVARNPSLATAYAARDHLPEEAVALLGLVEDEEIDAALAGNAGLALGGRMLLSLIASAAERPALARALLARSDLTPGQRAALYLHADVEGRRAIRAALEAQPDLEARAGPLRASVSVDRLVDVAAAGDVARFERALAAALGCPAVLPWTSSTEAGRELTALALLSLGAEPSDTITVALTLETAAARSTADIFALADLARQTAPDVAARIVQAVLGRTLQDARRGRHVPQVEEGTPARRGVFGLLRPSQAQDRAGRAVR